MLVLSVHDERTVADATLAAGADAVVLKRCLATDLMPAVDAVLAGQRYVRAFVLRRRHARRRVLIRSAHADDIRCNRRYSRGTPYRFCPACGCTAYWDLHFARTSPGSQSAP